MPSWKSSVRRSQSCSTSSRSVAASTASISPRRIVSRVDEHRQRRGLRDFERQGLRGAAHLGLRHQHIGEADPHRLVAGNAAAGVEQQRRLLRADEARQGHGQAEAGMEAEPVEIGAEPRLAAGDAEIGHQREAEPAADRRAVDRADDRLFRCGTGGSPPCRDACRRRCAPIPAPCRYPSASRNRRRRRNERPSAREHDRAAGRVGVDPLEGLADLGDQRRVEEIIRRPADFDRRDEAVEA